MNLNLPERINLYNELVNNYKKNPNKIVVEDTKSTFTYKRFLLSVNAMSDIVLKETKAEKHIGVLLPNVSAQVILLFSLFKSGQTPCLLNFTMGIRNIVDCIEIAKIKTVVTSKEFIEAANLNEVISMIERDVNIVYLEDIKESVNLLTKFKSLVSTKTYKPRREIKQGEVVLFTSGTESKPKGVVLTHRNIFANIRQAVSVIDINENDKIFNPLPLFHSFGLTVGAILPFITGTKSYLYPTPLHYKEIPKMISKDKSTVFVSTNTFFDNYVKHSTKEQLSSLRYVIAGAEKLKPSVHQKYLEEFGIDILQGYGATETSPIISLNTPTFNKTGTVGKMLPEMEYQIQQVDGIADGGSLLLRGPNVMKGYLLADKGFVAVSDWYDTGDVARVDDEGYLHIISRLKRFSKIAGEMISLNKLEELAAECYKDPSFYAVSIPDKRKGERIILFTNSSHKYNEKDLKRFIKLKKISPLYNPSKVEYIEEVPLLGSGKLNYQELTKIAANL